MDHSDKSLSPGVRLATRREVEAVLPNLRSMALFARAEAALDTYARLNPEEDEEELDLPVVVTDWAAVGEHMFLLVEAGHHDVPASVLEVPRLVVALPAAPGGRAVLRVVGARRRSATNLDTLESTLLATVTVVGSRFAGLDLDAEVPTVLETMLGGDLFTRHFHDCTFQPDVEVVDAPTFTLRLCRPWAFNAFGTSGVSVRSLGDRLIDGVGEAGDTAIDAVFAPLVRFGDAVDRMFGWGDHRR